MTEANPINVTRIDHVVIRVAGLESMVAFYRDVLGCRLERGPGPLGLAQLRAGESLIDLVTADGPLGKAGGKLPDHAAPNVDHVCLLVDPWDEGLIVAHLERHGVDVGETGSRYGATGMGPSIYIRDPEGNTVELKAPRT